MHLTNPQRTGIVIGGSILAGAAAVLITKKVMAASTATSPAASEAPPQATAVQTDFAPASQFTPGQQYYVLVSGVDPTAVTRATLMSSLASTFGQWDNAQVVYFPGDSILTWPPQVPFPQGNTALTPTTAVFAGTFSQGQAPLAVPGNAYGMMFVPPVMVPGNPTSTIYKGVTIETVDAGNGYVFGNTMSCKNASILTTLGSGKQLAIGASVAEVTAKLQNFIDQNGC